MKTRSLKSRKIAIFPKGLVHGFGQKLAIFPKFILRQYKGGKCVLRYSRTEKRLLNYKKKSSKKPKIIIIFKGVSPWFWAKIGHFSIFFFRQYRPGKCVLRYSRTQKNAVLGYKNKKFKGFKNCDFFKGVNPLFWSKIGRFSIFCFKAIQARKMSLTIL